MREQIVGVIMELLHLSINLVQRITQTGMPFPTSVQEIRVYFGAALDRIKLDTIPYSSRTNTDDRSQGVLGELAMKLRESLHYY